MTVEVEWVGDTANTPLKAKYDTAASKIAELKGILNSKNIVIDTVDNLHTTLGTLTSTSLNMVSTSADKVLTVANCISPVDPNIKSELLDSMKNAVNNILNGDVMNSFIESIQALVDNIENVINEAIAAVSDTVKSIEEAIENGIMDVVNAVKAAISGAIDKVHEVANNVINAISDALSVNIELDNVIQEFSQAMGKAAALINCLDDAILGDTQLGGNIEKVNTSLTGVVSMIKDAKSKGEDKTAILNNANKAIASNLDMGSKYSKVASKMSSLI